MAADPSRQPEQKNVVVNPAIDTVFFQSKSLAYNYKTNQWSRLPSADGKRFFQVFESDKVLGTIQDSSFALMVQSSSSSGAAPATATVVTGDFELNPSGRAIVDAARPITDGASVSSVKIGVKDLPSSSVTWATGTALNSRTGMSNFRGGANKPEGRYHRAEFIFTGGFTTITGADFEFFPAGKL